MSINVFGLKMYDDFKNYIKFVLDFIFFYAFKKKSIADVRSPISADAFKNSILSIYY